MLHAHAIVRNGSVHREMVILVRPVLLSVREKEE